MTTTNSSGQLDGETCSPQAGLRLCEGIASNEAQVAAVLDSSSGAVTGHVDDTVLGHLASMKERAAAQQQEAQTLAAVFREQINAADVARAAGVKDEGYLHRA